MNTIIYHKQFQRVLGLKQQQLNIKILKSQSELLHQTVVNLPLRILSIELTLIGRPID